MSKKNQIEQGLNGLLATPTPQEQAPTEAQATTTTEQKTEPICWNLYPSDIENVRRIAKYEGKRANAVVTEALRFYFKNWKPVPQEKPTLIL